MTRDEITIEYLQDRIDNHYVPYQNIKAIYDVIQKGIAPQAYPDSFLRGESQWWCRHLYTTYCSWAVIELQWVIPLAEMLRGKNVIEIMAGKGLLTHNLRLCGVEMKAYDNNSWARNIPFTYTDIIEMGALEAIRENENLDYVVVSWPPYGKPVMENVAKVLAYKHPKCKIVYIGESYGGCNATDDFFEMVDYDEFGSSEFRDFGQFMGIHDWIYIMRPNPDRIRRKSPKKRRKRGILK